MPKYTKNIVDADLRGTVFNDLFTNYSGDDMEFNGHNYQKINDRQYGVILTDKNGVERYCRVGVIVAEERDTETARELMAREIAAYKEQQEKKHIREEKKQAKILADKQRRQKNKEEE